MDNRKSLLLVEGVSDEAVVNSLCTTCGVSVNFEVKSKNSISKLKQAFKYEMKSTQIYEKLWLIIDADSSMASAWQSIRNIMIDSGKYKSSLTTKTPIPSEGIIIQPDDKYDMTIGVWIMPNNMDAGMLEDFVYSLIDNNDTLAPKANEIIEEIDSDRAIHPNIFKHVHKPKAKIHTWLAWQDEPAANLGLAILKNKFEFDKELCVKFTEWLNALN